MKRGELESHLLILATLGLTAFGLVMVYSATSASAAIGNGDSSFYLKRQGIYAVLGLVFMVLASRFPFRRLRELAPALLLSSLVLCFAVLVVASPINGARRWITAGPATFQPSELAKLALAVWVAAYLARRRPPSTLPALLQPIGIVAGLFCGLILLEPDLGTTIAIVVMLAAVLLAAGAPLRLLGLAGAITLALGFAAVWLEPYRRARVLGFIDPWHDAQGTGFQTVQAMIGLGSGGWHGVGLGQGVQKIFYLPEAHTDMIFAIVGEELGLIGTLAVVASYGVFAWAGLRIAMASRDPFGQRLAVGLTSLVCGQAVINLAAVLGVAPLTGIPLPFVSYGGSSLVVELACVGILLNIARSHADVARAQVPDRSRGDGRPRRARAGGRRGTDGQRGAGDLRRVAGSRRSSARS